MKIITHRKLKMQDPDYKLPKTSNLMKDILQISLPAALEIFLVGIMGMVDAMMVGNYSIEGLSAVTIAQQPIYATLAVSIGLNASIIAIISKRHGENKPKEANVILRQSLILGVFLSILIASFAIIIARPFLTLAGSKEDTINLATSYFRITTFSLTFTYLRLIICAAQRAVGKTKITLITNVAANLINVFFNYCLIGGNFGFPALGVDGAAIATVIGNVVACFIAIISIYKAKGFLSIKIKDDWHLNKEAIALIFKISFPAFIEQLFMRIGFFLSAKIVNELGTTITSINSVITHIMNMSFNITDGFAIGASALIGKSLGEKDHNKAYAYGRLSQLTSLGIAFLTMSVAILTRKPLARCFSQDSYIVNEASKYVLFVCVIMIPQSIQWVTTGILRGAGDTKYTAFTSVISITIIRPVLSYSFCYLLGFGLIGSWVGMLVDQSLRYLFNEIRFSKLNWLKIRV